MGVRTRASAYAVAPRDGRLLLTLVAPSPPVFAPGLRRLPGGGIDPGGQPVEAHARELHEGTGLPLAGTPRVLDTRTYPVGRPGVGRQAADALLRRVPGGAPPR